MSSFLAPRALALVGLVGSAGLAACTDDPQYLQPNTPVEIGLPDSEEEVVSVQFDIPYRLEEDDEAEDRGAEEAELGTMVPFVTLDDVDLSLEWTLRNLDDAEGTALILLNGANEYFSYVPSNFVVDPEEEEEPPPLAGGVPIIVPGLGTVSGVFREDQIEEMAFDLEQITRGAVNPFAAMLEQHVSLDELTLEDGTVVPRESLGHMVRFDVGLTANRHMVLEFAVRARSNRIPNILHDEGLNADPGELTVFEPAEFVPPPPEEP